MRVQLRNVVLGASAGVLAAAVLVPTLAGGNARPPVPTEVPLVARLTGTAEVPGPGDPDGSGAAALTIDAATSEICYDLAVAGIAPATAAHIHEGGPTTAGPIRVNLTAPTGGSSSACIANAETTAWAAIIAGNPGDFYVNVHNAEYTPGAVRGQLAVGPRPNNTYLLAEPLRAYDSRTGGGAKLQPGETRTVSLQSGTGIAGGATLAAPPGATAALVTLTITETEGAGYLKLYSAALATEPPTSNINWYTGDQNLAVATTVAIDEQGRVKVTAGFGATHAVLDVVGFLY